MIDPDQFLPEIENASSRIEQIAGGIGGQRQLVVNVLDVGCRQRAN